LSVFSSAGFNGVTIELLAAAATGMIPASVKAGANMSIVFCEMPEMVIGVAIGLNVCPATAISRESAAKPVAMPEFTFARAGDQLSARSSAEVYVRGPLLAIRF